MGTHVARYRALFKGAFETEKGEHGGMMSGIGGEEEGVIVGGDMRGRNGHGMCENENTVFIHDNYKMGKSKSR